MPLTIDASELRRAMREYGEATRKDEREILNRAGRNLAARAIQFTQKATVAKIKADLRRNRNAIRATVIRLRRAGVSIRGMSRERFGKEVQKTINLRARSAGYVAAGWFKALEAFGGARRKVSPRGKAAKGFGKKATLTSMVAVLANYSTGAEQVGGAAFQRAIDFVADDMLLYAQRVMTQTAARRSAR